MSDPYDIGWGATQEDAAAEVESQELTTDPAPPQPVVDSQMDEETLVATQKQPLSQDDSTTSGTRGSSANSSRASMSSATTVASDTSTSSGAWDPKPRVKPAAEPAQLTAPAVQVLVDSSTSASKANSIDKNTLSMPASTAASAPRNTTIAASTTSLSNLASTRPATVESRIDRLAASVTTSLKPKAASTVVPPEPPRHNALARRHANAPAESLAPAVSPHIQTTTSVPSSSKVAPMITAPLKSTVPAKRKAETPAESLAPTVKPRRATSSKPGAVQEGQSTLSQFMSPKANGRKRARSSTDDASDGGEGGDCLPNKKSKGKRREDTVEISDDENRDDTPVPQSRSKNAVASASSSKNAAKQAPKSKSKSKKSKETEANTTTIEQGFQVQTERHTVGVPKKDDINKLDESEPLHSVPPETKPINREITLERDVSASGPIHCFALAQSAKHAKELVKLPWAVQWAAGRHPEALEQLSPSGLSGLQLKNNVDGVPKLLRALKCEGDLVNFDRLALEELDREWDALNSNPTRGLGGRQKFAPPTTAPDPAVLPDDWYGGRVQFRISIRINLLATSSSASALPLTVVLLPIKLGPSSRISRFGSWNLLSMTVSDKTLKNEKMKDLWPSFWTRHFTWFGTAVKFRAFYAKDVGKRYLYRAPAGHGAPFVVNSMTVAQLWEFLNPMALNCEQKMSKYNARMALMLSDTVPTIEFKSGNIRRIDDIYVDGKNKSSASSENIMTDGCGLMNAAGFALLQQLMQWSSRLCAVQMRIGGAKGVLLVYLDDLHHAEDEEPIIWLRDSMLKIVFGSLEVPHDMPLARSRLILEVVRPARSKISVKISSQAVVVLVFNKVQVETVVKLFKSMLKEVFDAFVQWGSLEERGKVIAAIDLHCRVTASRKAREAGGEARARGLRDFSDEGDEDADTHDVEIDEGDEETATKALEEIVVLYLTRPEKVMRQLMAGFDPRTMATLREDIKAVMNTLMSMRLAKGHIRVPMSAEAMMVPDPFGVLEAGEIYYQSSEKFTGVNGHDTCQLTGRVLIYRNPLRLPTDIQMVTAVIRPELHGICDVIVVSVKGPRSLPSMLSGGDMDGDTAVIIWEKQLTGQFHNHKDLTIMDPPPAFKQTYFESATTSLRVFLEAEHSLASFMKVLHLDCVDPSPVGMLSVFHETAAYEKGLEHESAILLSHLFNVALDGAKQGDRIKESVFEEQKKAFGSRTPAYKLKAQERTGKRAVKLRTHVLDELWKEGKEYLDALLKEYDALSSQHAKSEMDRVVAQPWMDFDGTIPGRLKPRPAIELTRRGSGKNAAEAVQKEDVQTAAMQDVHEAVWQAMLAVHSGVLTFCRDMKKDWSTLQKRAGEANTKTKYTSKETQLKSKADCNLDRRKLEQRFQNGPSITSPLYTSKQIAELTASCAFWIDAVDKADGKHEHAGGRYIADERGSFAFAVAFEELCAIHAQRLGIPYQTIPNVYLNHMRLSMK